MSDRQVRAWSYTALDFEDLPQSHGSQKRKGGVERNRKANKRIVENQYRIPNTIKEQGL